MTIAESSRTATLGTTCLASTTRIRAIELEDLSRRVLASRAHPQTGSETEKSRTVREEVVEIDDGGDAAPPSLPDDDIPEKWNYPRGNIARLGFAFWGFMIAGLNDAAVGALIPYLETYYDLNYTIISLIFLTPFAGYATAAFLNSRIHVLWGQRGIAIMAPICHIITYIVLSLHPPFPALVVMFGLSGFGNGLIDACFCAWVGAMDKANAVQGFLHGFYSFGALFAPIVATSMIVKANLPWYTFYYIMIGASVLELVGLTVSFWRRTGQVYREQHSDASGDTSAGTRAALKSKVTFICAAFFFTYVGIEVGLGGWIVTFMLKVRSASPYASGISSSGFWAGMVVGRMALGFVTEHFGERLCLSIYLAVCIALELLFWLVPRFVVSAIAVSFLGFFLGPMFPGSVMMAAKLLPKRIHVSAMGFAMAFGGTGGTVFPFAIGAIAAGKGIQVLQPIVLSLIVVLVALWLSFPKVTKRD